METCRTLSHYVMYRPILDTAWKLPIPSTQHVSPGVSITKIKLRLYHCFFIRVLINKLLSIKVNWILTRLKFTIIVAMKLLLYITLESLSSNNRKHSWNYKQMTYQVSANFPRFQSTLKNSGVVRIFRGSYFVSTCVK